MEPIVVRGKIIFKGEGAIFNREFTATLQDSGASAYGNQTAVTIEFGVMANGEKPLGKLLDTRYDTTIRKNEKDFKEWVRKWFKNNYLSHTLTIY